MVERDASSSTSTRYLTQNIPGWKPRTSGAPYIVRSFRGKESAPRSIDAALLVLDAVTRAHGIVFDIRRATDFGVGGRHRSWLAEEGVEFCRSIFAAGGALFCGPIGGRLSTTCARASTSSASSCRCGRRPALADAAIAPARATRRSRHPDRARERRRALRRRIRPPRSRHGSRYQEHPRPYDAEQVDADRRASPLGSRVGAPRTARRGRQARRRSRGERAVEGACRGGGRGPRLDARDRSRSTTPASSSLPIARRFDVVVAPNLFGDVLADAARSCSARAGCRTPPTSEPEYARCTRPGTARRTTWREPTARTRWRRSWPLAMMLRESFGLTDGASSIELAIESVLASGVRTADFSGRRQPRRSVRASSRERIAQEAADLAQRGRSS